MRYTRISADCHVDLCWLPPDLFTSSASPAMKDRMPYVTAGPKGPAFFPSTYKLGNANCEASWLARCGQRWVMALRRV